MDLFEAINFLTQIPSLVFSLAIVAGIIYGIKFLLGLYGFSNRQSRGQVMTVSQIVGVAFAMVALINFPSFVQDSVMTMTGMSLEPVNPLSWSAVGNTSDSETLMATLLYRFFQVFGLVTLYSLGDSFAKISDPQSRGQVTFGGMLAKMIAGVMLIMPSATAEAFGVIIPLIGAFGEWMSLHHK